MSYQVLARKYRPQRFQDMIGHEGIRIALVNALTAKKLHHTYLFTGTRGTGKTSLARLLAKCLSCVAEVTSSPCETCINCLSIQNNQFVDLIEVDAASRTRVEDIQTLLENLQYQPTVGRYKIYLIDEIHMLSMHSFNALLKTLEEPPKHVIFLLATTDIQKVPETIISRCLHFHLNPLGVKEITQQLTTILAKEKIQYEQPALEKIAMLAKGSMRDALSLLEPVILHGDMHQVTSTDVASIFGYISLSDQYQLIQLITQKDIKDILPLIEAIASQSIDFEQLLNDLAEHFYQISVAQQLNTKSNATDLNFTSEILTFASHMQPEQVQLYYQMIIMSKKELFLAPTPQLSFKMTMLRLIAFTPLSIQASQVSVNPAETTIENPVSSPPIKAEETIDGLDWNHLVKALPMTGFLKSLALNCVLQKYESQYMELLLDSKQKALFSEARKNLLQEVLSQHLKAPIKLSIHVGLNKHKTPAMFDEEKKQQTKQKIYEETLEDSGLKAIQQSFNAQIESNAIQIHTDKYYE